MLKNSSALSVIFAALALLALSACGLDDNFTPRNYDANGAVAEPGMMAPSVYLDLSPTPPPAAPAEMSQVTDPRTQIWRKGHYSFEHQQFAWHDGEILTRPSPTAVWSADRWEHRKYGWAYINGYWQ